MNSNYIPYLQLSQHLGITTNDTLLISSDISKLAITTLRNEKKFNPALFINSFKQAANKGTLLFPAFTNLKDGNTFDIENSPPQTGTLSVSAFYDKSFLRSSDPFHSFMLWGMYAEVLSKLKNKSTFGTDSVFSFLHTNKAKLLLIDIDLQHSFTFAHYVEELEKVNYRKFKTHSITYISSNSKEVRDILFFEKKVGVSICLNNLYTSFKKNNVLKEYKLNNSTFTLIDLDKSVALIKNDIRKNAGKNLHTFSYKLWLKETIKKLINKK